MASGASSAGSPGSAASAASLKKAINRGRWTKEEVRGSYAFLLLLLLLFSSLLL